MNDDFDIFGGIVVDLAYLNLAFFARLEDGVDDAGCRFAVRYFRDDDSLVVSLLDLGAYLEIAASSTVIVF